SKNMLPFGPARTELGFNVILPVEIVVFPLPAPLKTLVADCAGTTPPLQFAPFDQFPSTVPSHVRVCPTAVVLKVNTSSTAQTFLTYSTFFISKLPRLQLLSTPPGVVVIFASFVGVRSR